MGQCLDPPLSGSVRECCYSRGSGRITDNKRIQVHKPKSMHLLMKRLTMEVYNGAYQVQNKLLHSHTVADFKEGVYSQNCGSARGVGRSLGAGKHEWL